MTLGMDWYAQMSIRANELLIGAQILEIYYCKAGFGPPQEQYASHARRRFRLVPSSGHPNAPQPDPNLFIIHWGPADQNEVVPSNTIPYDQRIHAQMQQRQFLLKAGAIRRKEFMLSDRSNWPSLPELTGRQMEPQMAPRGVPQQMAYPPQGVAGPPAKRPRHAQSQGGQAAPPGMQPMDPALDDDEDTSRGDMFDHLTPREISLGRYQQNHEWMEEILSSPYRLKQITPADLNLGLMGELASVTQGIFAAQGGDAITKSPDESLAYVGRLDPDKAKEFRSRVDDHIAKEKAEMEEMKKKYEAELAEMRSKSILNTKEKELRSVQDAGSELWMPHDGGEIKNEGMKKTVDDIIKEIESSTGRKIESQPPVKCVKQGGYQAPAPEPEPVAAPPQQVQQMSRQPSQAPSQASGLVIGDSDMDMGGTAAGLLDQMGTGLSSHSTPANNFPTPQAHLSAGHSNAATPQNVNVASPAVTQPPPQQQQPAGGDVSMGGTNDGSKTGPAQDTDSGDWVVVPKNGTPDVPTQPTPGNAAGSSGNTPKPTDALSSKPTPAAGTPGFNNDDFASLGDLDSAGDALAGYDNPTLDGSAGELGDGLDLNMDMDDSAFGDAFHGVDTGASGTPGGGHDM